MKLEEKNHGIHNKLEYNFVANTSWVKPYRYNGS